MFPCIFRYMHIIRISYFSNNKKIQSFLGKEFSYHFILQRVQTIFSHVLPSFLLPQKAVSTLDRDLKHRWVFLATSCISMPKRHPYATFSFYFPLPKHSPGTTFSYLISFPILKFHVLQVFLFPMKWHLWFSALKSA